MALDFGNMQQQPVVETPVVDDNSAALMNSVQETIKGKQEVVPPEIQVADASVDKKVAPIMQPVTPEEKSGIKPGEAEIVKMQDVTQEKFSEVEAKTQNIIQTDYGSYISVVDLSEGNLYKTRMDKEGKYYNVWHVIEPNKDVSGIEGAISYKLQDGMTAEEIEDTVNKRNESIRGSGDLTYQPDHQNIPLATVYAAEELTVAQMMRGMFNTAPFSMGIAAGKTLYKGYGALVDTKVLQGAGKTPMGKFLKNVAIWGSIGTGIVATGTAYHIVDKVTEKLEKEGISQFSSLGWAHLLFEFQQKEMELRKLDPNHVDIKQRPRTLTVEQFATLLDPKFASYWTKLANTLTEGGAATFTFGVGTKTMGLRDLDVLNIFTKGNNARMQKYHSQALENLKEIDQKLLKTGGIKTQTPLPQRVTNEIKKIIDAEELADKEQIFTLAARFIVGFERQQIGQKLLSPRKWLLEVGGGEVGAGALSSSAAEYNWYGSSARTEDIDKLGWVLAGATLFPNTLAFVPKILNNMPGRAIVGIAEGGSYATGWLTKKLSQSIDPEGRTQLGRYLSDSPENVTNFFTFIKGDKRMLPSNMPDDVKKAAINFRRTVLRMDAEIGGKIIDNMHVSTEMSQQVGELSARLYPDNPKAKEAFTEDTMGIFTGLEVIGAMEDFLINAVTSGNKVNLTKAQLRLQTALAEQKEKAIEKASKIYEDLLRMDVSTLEGDVVESHRRMTDALAETIQLHDGRTAELGQFIDEALAMTANNAFKKLITNPYEGQHEVEEVIAMMQSPRGKSLTITIDGTELTGTEAIKHMIAQVQSTLDDAYLLTMDGRRILDDTFTVSGKTHPLSIADQYEGSRTVLTSVEKMEVSGHHFAATMNNRRISAKAYKNDLYAEAFDNPEDSTLDVTKLYASIGEKIESISSTAAAGSNTAKATIFARQFFSDAVDESITPFIKTLGQGDYKKGIKALKKLIPKLKKLGVIIPAGSLDDVNKLGQALFSAQIVGKNGESQIEIINGVLKAGGLSELRLMIPTVEFRQGMINGTAHLTRINNAANAARRGADTYVGDKLFREILADLDTEANVKYNTRNEGAYKVALDFYKDDYLPMVNSTLWKESFGKTIGSDAKSPTTLRHKTQVHTWLSEAIKTIDPNDPLTGITFMNDFRAFFGTNPDTSAYKAAIAALDDTLIEMGLELPTRPYVTGLSDVATQKVKVGDPSFLDTTGGALLPDEVGFRSASSYATPAKISTTLSADKKYDRISGIVKVLENTNLYQKGQASNIFDKVNRAIRQGGPDAQKAINNNLDIVAKQIEKFGANQKNLRGQFNSMRKLQIADLQTFQKLLGQPGAMVEEMLNKPDLIDMVRDSFIKNSENGDELFKTLWAEGLLKLTEKGSLITKTDVGTSGVQAIYDAQVFTKLLQKNKIKLTKIFGADHINDMLLINQLLLRQTKAVQKGGYSQIKFIARKGANFVYGPASIISRLYAANSGRTSYRYIGAEAVAALLVNSDNKVITALMTNPKWAAEFRKFMQDPRQTMDSMSANTITWLHELAGAVSAVGQGIFIEETPEESDKYWFTEQVDKIISKGKETYGRRAKEPRSVLEPVSQVEQKAMEEAQIRVGAEHRVRDYGEAIEAVEGVKGFLGEITDFNF